MHIFYICPQGYHFSFHFPSKELRGNKDFQHVMNACIQFHGIESHISSAITKLKHRYFRNRGGGVGDTLLPSAKAFLCLQGALFLALHSREACIKMMKKDLILLLSFEGNYIPQMCYEW